MNSHPVEAELLRAGGRVGERTDRQKHMKVIVAF
jgi:hypothetical protein